MNYFIPPATVSIYKLQLNQDKTEFFIIAGPRAFNTLLDIELKLGNACIKPSSVVKNLGVYFDASLIMSNHVSNVCKIVNFHIRNLWRIRRFITQDACHHAVRALVLSRIDYANSLLYGVRDSDLKRLQRLQNKAARLVFACGRDQSSAGLLRSLHWLPVKERIIFKLMLYVYKCIHNEAPSYLSNLISLNRDSVSGSYRQRLCSASNATRLSVFRAKKRAGDSCFKVVAPMLWNELPCSIRESMTMSSFKSCLKTYLFPS